MTKKRIATLATCLTLVGAVAVGGTLALLTSQSDKVTNTFTVGQGYLPDDFYIDENQVKRDTGASNFGGYIEDGATRVKAIDYEDLVAGTTLAKDPTLHVKQSSTESWVVAKISGLTANAGKLSLEGTISGWYEVKDGELAEVTSAAELKDDTLYIYEETLGGEDGATDSTPLFETVRVASSVEAGAEFTNIEVTGVAVEAVEGASLQEAYASVLAAADAVI